MIPNPEDACSFYRGAGPLLVLRQICDVDILQVTPTDSWANFRQFDIVFFQRPSTQVDIDCLELCRLSGIPTWVDYDDDFTAIPESNPCWEFFSNAERQEKFIKCCKLATILSCTTQDLRETLLKFNPNVLVIPNAHDDYLLGAVDQINTPRKKVVLWRGSNTHYEDLITSKENIFQMAKDFPEWEWHFAGYNPFFLDQMQYKYHPAKSILNYFKLLSELRPSVVYVPLAENQFNYAKSNIAWIEASWAGATVVAPEFTEWIKPGVINFDCFRVPFHIALRHAIQNSTDQISDLCKQSRDYIKENLCLSKVNEIRKSLVEQVHGLHRVPKSS